MNDSQPSVSVVIPARGAAETLPLALESIAAQTYPNIIEVVVAAADGASAEAASGAIVVHNPTGTTPAGLNLAVAASTGELIVRCDAHAVLPTDYVRRAVETILRTGAAGVGGMQVPRGETGWERAIAAAMSSRFGAGDARYRVGGDEGPVETVYLGAYRREALERIGGFDETFVRTQDYELNHRLIESGAVVWFDPALKVEYRPRGSLHALARQYFQYGQAKRRFMRRHPGSLRWRQLAAPLLLGVLIASSVGALWAPVLWSAPLLYLIAALIAGGATRTSPARVAAALITMHLSWGAGFFFG